MSSGNNIGFTQSGITQGSDAAKIQSDIGKVSKDSTFS